jgi:DUF2934 family protein
MAKTEIKSSSKPTHEEIAQRAQAIYEQTGRQPGRDQQNWLEAESQLMRDRNTETGSAINKTQARPRPM